MPFGIPPCSPTATAVGDYCQATQEQLTTLITGVVQPIATHCDDIDTQLKEIVSEIAGFVSAVSSGIDGVVSEISQLVQTAEQTYQQQYGTPPTITPIPPVIPITTGVPPVPPASFGSGPICPESPITDLQSLINVLSSLPVSVYVSLTPEQQGAITAIINSGQSTPAVTPLSSPSDGLGVTSPPPPPPEEIVATTHMVRATESFALPPKSLSGLPCPRVPNEFATGRNPIGTRAWCVDADNLTTWFEGLGSQLADWIEDKTDPRKVIQWIHDNTKQGKEGVVAETIGAVIRWIVELGGEAYITVVRLTTDVIRCAYYYTRALTPIRKPLAYQALLILRNIIRWIASSRIGSQSYTAITVGTNLTLPHLERYIDMLLEYLCNTEIPGVGEVQEAWLLGRIKDDQFECMMRLNGCDPHTWAPFTAAKGERLTSEMAVEMVRRNGGDNVAQMEALRNLGWVDDIEADKFLKLYDELPNISDHMHWLQKNVYVKEYVDKYQLMDGFQDRFWKEFGPDLSAQGYTESRAAKEYAAHWIMPAPVQMLEMVYRLRPGKDGVTTPFTLDDYERILAEQDFNPLARKWFAQTAYKVPALTYLRDMHRIGLITDTQMQSYHADLGYTEDDSKLFVAVDTIRRERQRSTQGSGLNPAALRKGYAVGLYTHEVVRDNMLRMGYHDSDIAALETRAKTDLQYRVLARAFSAQLSGTVSQIKSAIKVGVMSVAAASTAMQHLGWTKDQSDAIAELADADARTALVRQGIGRIRSAFLQGEVDAAFATQSLLNLGVVADAAARYIATWHVEQTPSRKRRTAKEITNDVAEANLSPEDAMVRLGNLGYSDADTRLFMADASRATVTTEAALVAAQGLTGRQQSAQLAELGGRTIGLSRRIVAQLQKQEPPAKLMRWYIDDIVSDKYARNRLQLYGWDDAAIDKWLQEADHKKADQDEE